MSIIVDNKLNFHDNIHEKIKKSYQMLGILKRNFKYMSVKTWTTLYKSFVRSHLENGVCVWHPNKKYLIDELERVQRRATKMLKQCKNLSYENRLKMLNLPTLTYRRFRGDMIETYKILNNVYDKDVVPLLALNNNVKTRGNSLKLSVNRAHLNLKKFYFTSRIVNNWNSLPDTVITAPNINIFKNKLDEFCKDQDIKFKYRET